MLKSKLEASIFDSVVNSLVWFYTLLHELHTPVGGQEPVVMGPIFYIW